ncbi:hypothetical protein GCQ56_07770 [Marinifilum sp. N1E240]|uniref:hypothetical protein n=1 Tax=Marinifilum sp. N1E240 TaxID=2608082 RepID=UPI00128E1F95|nr:hypothetical protein [Marinifilum sp. N1E240]MPQ46911.1 hypothetical protein [Marinifilum sp. N1E240]
MNRELLEEVINKHFKRLKLKYCNGNKPDNDGYTGEDVFQENILYLIQYPELQKCKETEEDYLRYIEFYLSKKKKRKEKKKKIKIDTRSELSNLEAAYDAESGILKEHFQKKLNKASSETLIIIETYLSSKNKTIAANKLGISRFSFSRRLNFAIKQLKEIE